MPSFDKKIKAYLDRLANSANRPHSHLFFGPQGAGKKEAAYYFIQKVSKIDDDRESLSG